MVWVLSDRTCENLEQVLKHAVTPWWATSQFPGLSLCNLSIGLGIGVDTSFTCQVSSQIFQRSHKIGCKQMQLDHVIRVTATLKAILKCNIVFVKISELGIHL